MRRGVAVGGHEDQGVAALESTLLFGALPDAVLRELAAASTLRPLARGQDAVAEGDPGGDVVVVVQGRLKVVVRSRDGGEVVLARVGVGDTLGELSVFDRAPRAASAQAVEASSVLLVPCAAVRSVVRDHPDLAEELLRQQAEMLRRSNSLVADLVFLDLPRRLAKHLLGQAGGRARVELGMSQTELASALGGVRQSVNTALQSFVRRGWVRVDGQAVELLDRDALERYSALEPLPA